MADSFLFYDLETFGQDPRRTRISQYAAIRTDADLNEIDTPVSFFVRPADDLLPSPMATLVTGITPQQALAEGISEAELARVKTQWIASTVYERDSVQNQAQELGSNWVQGFPLDAEERLLTLLRTITAEEVQAVAAKYFGDDQLTIATLLPQPLDAPRARPQLPAGAVIR